jgi:hypothetical protein
MAYFPIAQISKTLLAATAIAALFSASAMAGEGVDVERLLRATPVVPGAPVIAPKFDSQNIPAWDEKALNDRAAAALAKGEIRVGNGTCLSTEPNGRQWYTSCKGEAEALTAAEAKAAADPYWSVWKNMRIEPGISFSWNYGYELGCTDLIDAWDAHFTKETGVRMHRDGRPANSQAPNCEYLSSGVQFKIVKVDGPMKVNPITGMSAGTGSWGNPAFRRLCLRQATQNKTEACLWVVVFLP